MLEINSVVYIIVQFILKTLVYSLVPTLVTLLLTEKIKAKIKGTVDEKIERIKKEHSLEISKFQADLNFLKTRENFKFTKLHEKRMEVLENVYKYLNEAQQHLQSYVTPLKQVPVDSAFEQFDDSLNENFRNAHNKFISYYSDNKIYLDEEIETLIDEYLTETTEVYNDYFENHFLRKLGDNFNQESFKKAAFAYKKIPDKVIPIKRKIELKFKKLLGD